MSIIALSGWGQPPDALREAAPGAEHLDYTATGSVDAAIELLAARRPRAVIGWSMGGQLAVRAIEAGAMLPQRLVLIATPFQFIRSQTLPLGMSAATFALFSENYLRNPERTFRKSYALIAHGDSRAAEMEPILAAARARLPQRDWLYWLEALSAYSSAGVDFSAFPPTLLLHGDADAVVDHAQAPAFARALPEARLENFAQCGHAPHWHDTARAQKLITEFIA